MPKTQNGLRSKFPYDGPAMVSTGSGVRIVALGKVEVVRVGVKSTVMSCQYDISISRPEKQTKVNAKTSTTMGAVKVTAGKGFRLGGAKAARTEAAFA
jgi:hypothetical protein